MKRIRSVLYVPGSKERVMKKAAGLGADALILDLEDSVAPESKGEAREMIVRILQDGDGDDLPRLVRCNSSVSPWWRDDLAAVVRKGGVAPAGIVVPKVESGAGLAVIEEELVALETAAGWAPIPLWPMIESPLGVLNAYEIACWERVEGLVLGTNDLAELLHASFGRDREPLQHALSQVVLAARAAGVLVLDGVFVHLQDAEGFALQCAEGARWGFDGKTLIHPNQVAPANRAFLPSEEAVESARRILAGWRAAREKGEEICVVDGCLVERLHARDAERIVALADG